MQLKASGLTVWSLVSVSMIVIFFFLLSNISLCTAQLFCSTQVFFTILISSFLMIFAIMILQLLQHPKAKESGKQSLLLFAFRDWKWSNLLWIPLGLLLIFGDAYVGSLLNSAILSIAIAGVVMGVSLYRTNSIVVPILQHGIYNSIVVWFQSFPSGSLLKNLALSPTFVPSFGNNLSTYLGLTNEIVFQLFLVAIAEEVFKVFIITFIIVRTQGKFDVKNSALTWIALFAAIAIWTVMHTIDNPYNI